METGPTACAVRLEAQSLRVELRVEVEPGYHAFFPESFLLDQQQLVAATLPAALASAASPLLHQILESVAAQLHQAFAQAQASSSSLVFGPGIRAADQSSTGVRP